MTSEEKILYYVSEFDWLLQTLNSHDIEKAKRVLSNCDTTVIGSKNKAKLICLISMLDCIESMFYDLRNDLENEVDGDNYG